MNIEMSPELQADANKSLGLADHINETGYINKTTSENIS